MDEGGIFPAQINTHPWREGVTYERFLLDDLTRQAREFHAAMPAEENERRRAQWSAKPVQTARDRYGVLGTVG